MQAPHPRRVKEAVSRLKGLPACFPVLLEALRMTEDPLCSFQELERVLSVEQSLASQLLRLANSAFYAVQAPITTISRAIAVIGQIKLRMMLLQMFVTGLFFRMVGRDPLAAKIWEESVAAAAGCKAIAEFFPDLDSDELLVGGLLHNIGEFALLSQFPKGYQEAVSLAARMDRYEAQVEVFGVDSREVGRWLLEAWRLPRILAEAVQHWQNPKGARVDSAGWEFIKLVHIGVSIGRAWASEATFEAALTSLDPDALADLGLELDVLSELYDNLSEPAASVRGIRDAICSAA